MRLILILHSFDINSIVIKRNIQYSEKDFDLVRFIILWWLFFVHFLPKLCGIRCFIGFKIKNGKRDAQRLLYMKLYITLGFSICVISQVYTKKIHIILGKISLFQLFSYDFFFGFKFSYEFVLAFTLLKTSLTQITLVTIKLYL